MLHRLAVKGVVLSLLSFSLVLPLKAQETPKMDVFAGYSFLRTQAGGPVFLFPPTSSNPQKLQPIDGFNASITGNFNRWVGITGDLSGYYSGAGIKNHTLLVGPQVSFRQAHGITPFIHGLFGANYQSPARQSLILDLFAVGPGPTPAPFIFPPPPRLRGSHTAFAMAFGGGVDYNVNPKFSIRIVQADYFRNSFKFTQGFASEFCDGTTCSISSIFNSATEKHNNLRMSFGVVFHL